MKKLVIGGLVLLAIGSNGVFNNLKKLKKDKEIYQKSLDNPAFLYETPQNKIERELHDITINHPSMIKSRKERLRKNVLYDKINIGFYSLIGLSGILLGISGFRNNTDNRPDKDPWIDEYGFPIQPPY